MNTTQDHFNSRNAVDVSLPVPTADRAWFLRDSTWSDVVWIFSPTNVLEEPKTLRIRWDFEMPSGERFTDARHASLLETSRQFIALVRTHSLGTGLSQRATTVLTYFTGLRTLVLWMNENGLERFAELDEQSLLQYHQRLRQPSRAPTTVLRYLYVFSYLYKFRDRLDDGLRFTPFPGRTLSVLAGVRESEIPRWPYTPEAIAVPLIQGSIELISQGASSILAARSIYSQSMREASQNGLRIEVCSHAATRALRRASIVISVGEKPIQSVGDLCLSIDMLYAACFVVIAYLVGARASEILHLRSGCVQQRETINGQINVIVGAIFKLQPEYHGHSHEWVAPPAAVKAVEVLEALSASHRERTGESNLWLRRGEHSGATEWHNPDVTSLKLCSAARIRDLLARLAMWLNVPKYESKAWVLTTHQGRKTFARFAALRDRSSLFALAQQLGHRDRAITDQGYSGSDHRLNDEIDAEILEQSVSAWEHMLTTPGLGGRAGVEIVAKRPRFSGARLKQDIKSYARMLVDAGLVLGICDWGFCVYRENSSACLGNAAGPNPVKREQSTCARCANFAVSNKHRPYWREQARQCELLLDEPALPLQTVRVVRERLNEAQSLVRVIDAASQKGK